jgi:hypothetical protein
LKSASKAVLPPRPVEGTRGRRTSELTVRSRSRSRCTCSGETTTTLFIEPESAMAGLTSPIAVLRDGLAEVRRTPLIEALSLLIGTMFGLRVCCGAGSAGTTGNRSGSAWRETEMGTCGAGTTWSLDWDLFSWTRGLFAREGAGFLTFALLVAGRSLWGCAFFIGASSARA